MPNYGHRFDTSKNATGNANPYTTTYTAGINTTGCTLLCLGIVVRTNVQRTGGSPTFGGVTMTKADITRVANETNSELWYLIDPPSGTTQNLSIPNTNVRTLYVTLASYCVNDPPRYKTVFDTATGQTTTTAGSYVRITTNYYGSVLFQIQGCGNNNPPTAQNQTLLYKVDRGNYSDDSQYALQTDPATTTFTWTFGSDDYCSSLAAWGVARNKTNFDIS